MFSVCDGLRCSALVFVLCGLADRAAAVPSEDGKPKANTLLAEARQLYDQGEYGGALDRLNQAYAAFPSPVIHFNFGQVYRALLRDVEAFESFDRFLSEGTGQDPTLRHEAEIYLVELSHRVGTIEISTNVEGANVSIDGKPSGTTPLRRGLRVMPGAHQILVQGAEGAIPFIRRIDVAAGDVARVDAKIEKAVAIASTPAPVPTLEPRPLYVRWWFWAGVGAVVVGTIVTTLVIASSGDNACAYNAGCITFP